MYHYFISLHGWITFHCMDIIHLCIHSLVDAYLGCFHILVIMKCCYEHSFTSLGIKLYFTYLGSILRSGIAGTYLVVQWLRLCASTAGGVGSIPVGELRSHMPRGTAKTKQNKEEVELLSHMSTLCLTFWETTDLFHSPCMILYSYQQRMRIPISPQPC